MRIGILDLGFFLTQLASLFPHFKRGKTLKTPGLNFGIRHRLLIYCQVTKKELQERTRLFALNVLRYLDIVPKTSGNVIIINQLGRAATSVPANYRAACRGRSYREFVSKIGIVEEESDESYFWLSFLQDKNGTNETLRKLIREADELTALFTTISKTSRAKLNLSKGK